MKRTLQRKILLVSLFLFVIMGFTYQAFATPILYDVGGWYWPTKETRSNVSGVLLLDDNITLANPDYPEGSGKYDVLMFFVRSDQTPFYEHILFGTNGSLSFNFLLDASLNLYDKDDMRSVYAFSSLNHSNTNELLDSYAFEMSTIFNFPNGERYPGYLTLDKAPVPEPATMLLFGTGIAGLIGSRIRRNKLTLHNLSSKSPYQTKEST